MPTALWAENNPIKQLSAFPPTKITREISSARTVNHLSTQSTVPADNCCFLPGENNFDENPITVAGTILV